MQTFSIYIFCEFCCCFPVQALCSNNTCFRGWRGAVAANGYKICFVSTLRLLTLSVINLKQTARNHPMRFELSEQKVLHKIFIIAVWTHEVFELVLSSYKDSFLYLETLNTLSSMKLCTTSFMRFHSYIQFRTHVGISPKAFWHIWAFIIKQNIVRANTSIWCSKTH